MTIWGGTCVWDRTVKDQTDEKNRITYFSRFQGNPINKDQFTRFLNNEPIQIGGL